MSSLSRKQIPLPSHWPRHVRPAIVRAAIHSDARIRAQAEIDRLPCEIDLLLEETRIKDARMERLPAQRRPHYQPIDRLAILALRAARGWSQAETARRLDDEGPDALVQTSEPVNRFPELVSYLVQLLEALCPKMGARRSSSWRNRCTSDAEA